MRATFSNAGIEAYAVVWWPAEIILGYGIPLTEQAITAI
jgi:hypothetical protein